MDVFDTFGHGGQIHVDICKVSALHCLPSSLKTEFVEQDDFLLIFAG
ncbi:hypothetical protein FHS27_006463 [Rhodopirellula rubra]|uniref:Uncharacterized protein n=1 Tax=Aporhodopirellula rubra TaxID=980271 RepID=A0A7W5E5N3_9BACT|nr:hypothetical protein [Aporhodopirellula rubra]